MPRFLSQQRRERFRVALNLFDMLRVENIDKLLAGKADLRREAVVLVDEDRRDETAVPLTCDLVTACCLADVMRSRDRQAGDSPCRAYISKDGGPWRKVASDAVLSAMRSGKPIPSPALFQADFSGSAKPIFVPR